MGVNERKAIRHDTDEVVSLEEISELFPDPKDILEYLNYSCDFNFFASIPFEVMQPKLAGIPDFTIFGWFTSQGWGEDKIREKLKE